MTLYASDFGYSPNPLAICRACGSHELFCCDGHGNRLTFQVWANFVDSEICRIEGTVKNEIEAPYAEMYLEGLSVDAAVGRATSMTLRRQEA